MRILKKIVILGSFLLSFTAFSQSSETIDSTATIPFIRFQFTHLFPAGDYEDTFGNTNAIGGAFGIKLKNNLQFELEANYMFGADVKRKGLLSDIINSRGDVTDKDGELIKLIYDLRGFSIYANVGKVFSLNPKTSNSGILTQFGIGFLQHKIIVDYRDGEVFQLEENNLKGYDRLHRGIALKQFIGYQYFGKKNLVNFYAGVEFQEGFTKNKREFNYDTQSFDTNRKFDLLYGFRIGWSFTIRDRATEDFYYY